MESQQFGDQRQGRFFMRIDFEVAEADRRRRPARRLRGDRRGVRAWTSSCGRRTAPYRTLIMVSKHLHCLNDLLFRTSTGALQIEVPAVVSNHPDAEALVRPTASTSTTSRSRRRPRPRPRRELLELVDDLGVDLVVLARYMQVLSDDLCQRLERPGDQHPPLVPAELQGRQALPRGLRPRRQAGRRDRALRHRRPRRGPDHRAGRHPRRPRPQPEQLVAAGRDVEAAGALPGRRWHAQTRVLLNGNRTVVFR